MEACRVTVWGHEGGRDHGGCIGCLDSVCWPMRRICMWDRRLSMQMLEELVYQPFSVIFGHG